MPKSKRDSKRRKTYKRLDFVRVKTEEFKQVERTSVNEEGETITSDVTVMVPAYSYILRANHNFNLQKSKSA